MNLGDRSMDATLRAIERRVVHDVWIGPVPRVTGATLTAVLCAAAVLGAQAAFYAEYRVAFVAHLVSVVAALGSVGGLLFRRFVWVCIAAYGSSLAAVCAVGAFWWYRTGTGAVPIPWQTTVCCVVVIVLAVGWVWLLTVPLERSQPDMRRYTYEER
ncbi:hypothetical protein ACTJJE_17395 [Mycolicibacterium sp. 22603]|uniref:hypothetical protein n=1 Tax=Mycolicibacterium TaxID=1866885 RepID=UPI00248AA338|nr:hypothetical protein [Mycolicibacterium neoaurum]WBP92735.1 hypothetical protein O7W24_16225 [Mycolicibacterium neoaurum]WBS06297.1 hypothetical protein O6072_15545 [Mycolicibacterium neoaurum]